VIATAAIAVAAVAVIVNAANGGPSSTKDDSSATRAYLQARYSFEQASEALLPEGRAAVDRLVAGMSAGCSGVLRNAPAENGVIQRKQDEGGALRFSTRNLLLLEIATAVDVTLRGPGRPAIGSFVDTARQLRWSNRELTNIIHSFGNVEAARLRRRVPDLCHDIKAWVASGYRHVPANAEAAEPGVEGPEEELSNALSDLGCVTGYPQRSILQLLTPYQDSSEPTSNRVGRLEAKVSAAESAILGKAVAQAERVLGLPREEGRYRSAGPPRRRRGNRPLPARGCTRQPSSDLFPVPGSSRRLANPTTGK
jgi:hypothetical protein